MKIGMFIITFIIGLKTMKVTQKEVSDYQRNSLENKTNDEIEKQRNQAVVEELAQYDSTNTQYIPQEKKQLKKIQTKKYKYQ